MQSLKDLQISQLSNSCPNSFSFKISIFLLIKEKERAELQAYKNYVKCINSYTRWNIIKAKFQCDQWHTGGCSFLRENIYTDINFPQSVDDTYLPLKG